MTTIERSALVPYTADQMFDVVEHVAAYPDFLPWCSRANVLEQSREHQVAELELSRAGMMQRFTTRNTLERPGRITLALVRGPFRRLTGEWRFTPLGNMGCKVELMLTFEMDGQLMKMALGQLWAMAADRMVDAFCVRAESLYG